MAAAPDLSCLNELRLDTTFFRTVWRIKAAILRGHASKLASATAWESQFKEWCKSPVQGRLFSYKPDGSSIAAKIPDPGVAYDLYEKVSTAGEPVTVLLNKVETVDPIIGEIHAALGVAQDWRKGDVVATLSAAGSGIGYHAGNEDGFIIQLAGLRHWRAWHADHTPENYQYQLLGLPGTGVHVPVRPTVPPSLEVVLGPGDVMYLPPLFAHEGVTIEKSVSLSIAWRGITPYTLIKAILGEQLSTLDDVALKLKRYGALLQDPVGRYAQDDIFEVMAQTALDAVDATPELRSAVTCRLSREERR